jgi:hypothetical protein
LTDWFIIVAATVIVVGAVGYVAYRRRWLHPAAHEPPSVPPPETCTVPPDRVGDVLKGVYHPSRLKLLAKCAVAQGVVTSITHEPDGDYHIKLKLDTPYLPLLYKGQSELVVEVIPADQGTVKIPETQVHVHVEGPWVYDRIHNWQEIHPVWKLEIIA